MPSPVRKEICVELGLMRVESLSSIHKDGDRNLRYQDVEFFKGKEITQKNKELSGYLSIVILLGLNCTDYIY